MVFPSNDWTLRRTRLVLAVFLSGLTAFRIYYAQSIPLAADEANYWQWSRHLDWGYFDQGPLIAWLIRLGTWACGSDELGVRMTSIIFSLGLSLVVFDFCRRIFEDETLGLWLVLAINAAPVFALGSIISTYDTPMSFFWLLGADLVATAIFRNRPWAWPAAGLAVGLAGLAKYTAVLLPVFTVAYLTFSPRRRFWLTRPQPWLAALIAGLMVSPNIFWNATHHWAAFRHTFSLTGSAEPWKFTTFEFIASQAGMVGPIFFVMLLLGLGLAWRQARQGDDLQAFLWWTSVPVWGLFLLFSVKTRVYANWPVPGYLTAFLSAGLACRSRLTMKRSWRRWAVIGLASGFLLVAGAHGHAPLLKVLDLPFESDPAGELYGWPEMGRTVGRIMSSWPERTRPFIFGLRYQEASLAAFYTPGQPETRCLFLPGYRLNAYVFWTDPLEIQGRDGLGVIDRRYTRGEPDLGRLFEQVTVIKNLELKDPAGRVVNRVTLYHGRGFKGRDYRVEAYGWPEERPVTRP